MEAAAPPSEGGDGDDASSLADLVQSLDRLAATLRALPDGASAPRLSHYRVAPAPLRSALDLLRRAAAAAEAGATKVALLGKIDAAAAAAAARDELLPAGRWLGTAALVLHQDSTGAGRSLRRAVKRAACAIVLALRELLAALAGEADGAAAAAAARAEGRESLAAQRTGAVWEACRAVTGDAAGGGGAGGAAALPDSNRSAMRRALDGFVRDCNETLQEFQDMIDAGPSLPEDVEDDEGGAVAEPGDAPGDDEPARVSADESSWEQFLGGATDQYTTDELPVAAAALALVKCARGCVNVAARACDAVGKRLSEAEGATDDGSGAPSDQDQARLAWIAQVFDCAYRVGDGMTDLGATLYPPLQRTDLVHQMRQQAGSMEALLDLVMNTDVVGGEALVLGGETTSLATKVQAALKKRREEAEALLQI